MPPDRLPPDRRAVTLAAGRVAASWLAPEVGVVDAPVVVCVHGGGYTGRYFDVAGASLLEEIANAGMHALTLDRPDHGASPALERGADLMARNASIMIDAVEEFLAQHHPTGHGRVVIVGHSIGGAIAVVMAARRPAWLCGISVSGLCVTPVETLARLTRPLQPWIRRLSLPAPALRRVLFGAAGTFDRHLARRSLQAARSPLVVQEVQEIAHWWPAHVERLAGMVEVPAQLVLAEHDALWASALDDIRRFGEMFTRSRAVTSELMLETGHCIDHHRAGAALHERQLGFARHCTATDTSAPDPALDHPPHRSR